MATIGTDMGEQRSFQARINEGDPIINRNCVRIFFFKSTGLKTLIPPEIKRLLITASFIQLHSLNCCKSTLHLFIALVTYDSPQIGSKSFFIFHFLFLRQKANKADAQSKALRTKRTRAYQGERGPRTRNTAT